MLGQCGIFNPEVLKVFTILVVIHAKVEGLHGSNMVDQIGPNFKFTSVDTTSHIINLKNLTNDICINHHHEDKPPSSGNNYYLKINPDEISRCFILYNDFNCKGPRLKFPNVVREKVLALDRVAMSTKWKPEKLQNFDIAPSSFSRCSSPFAEEGTNGGCINDYALQIGNSVRTWITDECTDIFAEESIKYNTVQMSIWPLNDNNNYKNGNGNEMLCIETYSRRGCSGAMIQFSTIAQPAERSIKLWHFYAASTDVRDWNNGKTSNAIIDTNIKSVRKCCQFSFKSVDANARLIDLNKYANRTCLTRQHQDHDQGKPVYKLRIKPFEGSRCFIVYSEPNCEGVRLKFHNVNQKRLRFARENIDEWNEEKLLNFDITPSSISGCPTGSEYPGSNYGKGLHSECDYDYLLRVGDSKSKLRITEKCTDVIVDEYEKNKYSFWYKSRNNHNYGVAIFFDGILRKHGSSHSHHGDSRPQICIQTYSQKRCTGEMIQYIIAKPFTKKDLGLLRQPSIKIWQFYYRPPNKNYHNRRVKYEPIDTPFESVRRCPCHHKPVMRS